MRRWFVLALVMMVSGCMAPAPPEPILQARPSTGPSMATTKRITRDGAGGFILPDGSRVAEDQAGGFTLPNGAYVAPDGDGNLLLPNGVRCVSDGATGYVCP
jgi:hypothetical protein